jgi:CRP-like cAMP-binding protein
VSVFVTQKLNNFFSKFKKYRYKKGEVILHGGDVPQGVYFIDKGYVRDYSVSKDGEGLTLFIFKSEDFFPMQWVFNDRTVPHYFESMTAVELWRCPRENFITFIKTNPEIFLELVSRIMLRLGGLLQRMEYLAFGNAHQKVASILMICAERFGKKSGKSTIIQVPLTHKDLAMVVGMTRETVSIEMGKLEREKIISYKKHLISIKDMHKLLQESLAEDAADIIE